MELAPIIGTLGGGLLALVLAIYFWIATGRGGQRTQAVFFTILAAVLLVVAAGLGWRALTPGAQQQPLVALPKGPVQVRILTALPVEPWVREAAQQFNQKGLRQDGQPIEVQVIAMDGLTALGKFDRDDFGALGAKTRDQLTAQERQKLETTFPTVWIPDSRYLVELANVAYKERLGRDVFLTDGEYRARPVAISLFTWGIYQSRASVLDKKFGAIDWQVIHDAAIAKGGWPELGGDPAWGFFKLVVPNPRRNVGGLAAMIAAAGEYYDKTNISTAEVTDPKFQKWLKELMGSLTDVSGASAYTAEDFALFGYSVGDGGQLLESDLLNNMAGIQTRWSDPLVIRYPKYVTWFDFPYTVWVGPETTAAEKNAALQFQRFLLTPEMQKLAVKQGLRSVSSDVSVTDGDTLFTRWQKQGVEAVVPRTTRMTSPSRDVLLALLRWFDLNVGK
ncbi:MAG: ABC transporter substrate-binding protein [Chloroflexi bacterium]|nr:ABC transporter substrate-binding protein [Chloroflexota bacterium]